MKRALLACGITAVLAFGLWVALSRLDARWAGVDETVVEKVARDAGHPPRSPYIDTDRGDLLLFFFLVAGTVGGFLGGYHFRGLFETRP
ncbi:MAG: hypothetical protein ACYC8T_17980 [Myxococcaceae bacterium]